MKTMKRIADRVLVIFPFEEEIYRKAGVTASSGSAIRCSMIFRPPRPRGEIRTDLGVRDRQPARRAAAGKPRERSAADPAGSDSRRQADPRSSSGRPVRRRARTAPRSDALFAPLADLPGSPVVVVDGMADDVLAAADVALVASGTVTVQAALHECPMVVVYRLSPLTYRLGQAVRSRRHICDGQPGRRPSRRARTDSGDVHAGGGGGRSDRHPDQRRSVVGACARICARSARSSAARGPARAPRARCSTLSRHDRPTGLDCLHAFTDRLTLALAPLAYRCHAPVHATVLLPAEFREIVGQSQIIAYGRVIDAVPELSDDRKRIDTVVTFEVGTYLKGGRGDTITFRVPGGQVGRYRSVTVGAPMFESGDEAVLFLTRRPDGLAVRVRLESGRVPRPARRADAAPDRDAAAPRARSGAGDRRPRRRRATADAARDFRRPGSRRDCGAGERRTMTRRPLTLPVAAAVATLGARSRALESASRAT